MHVRDLAAANSGSYKQVVPNMPDAEYLPCTIGHSLQFRQDGHGLKLRASCTKHCGVSLFANASG